MGLGVQITQLRLQKAESLQQVADAVGVSKAHIWELEKGRTIRRCPSPIILAFLSPLALGKTSWPATPIRPSHAAPSWSRASR